MTLVVGIDPGLSGALALWDGATLDIVDMPTTVRRMSKKDRIELDVVGLNDLMCGFWSRGVELVVIERVGGIVGQSAPASFNFGYACGPLEMACVCHSLPRWLVPALTWKAVMGVRGKRASAVGGEATKAERDTAILEAGIAVFGRRPEFHGPRGGLKIDRVEAALIAEYGRRLILGGSHER